MKTKIVAWLCFLVMIVSLIGCSKTNEKKEVIEIDKDISIGAYVEQEISRPEMEPDELMMSMILNDKSQLEIYTMKRAEDLSKSTHYCYTLVDGCYQKISVEWLDKASSENSIDSYTYCHGQDGSDYISYVKPLVFDDQGQPLADKLEFRVLKQGKESNDYVDITPVNWKPGTLSAHLEVTKDGILCYMKDGNLTFYDTVKQEEVDYGIFSSFENYILQSDTIYYIDQNEVQMVQLGENKVEKIAIESESTINYLQVSPKGDVIILDSQGIHQLKKGGTMWETIVDGKQAKMSSPNYMVRKLLLLPGTYDTYYILYNNVDDGQQILATYQLDENVIASNINNGLNQNTDDQLKKELTIYSVWTNLTLQQAVYEYTNLHPEVTINLNVAVPNTEDEYWNFDVVKQSETIRSLNVEILTGNGADIFMLDGLSSREYIEKGVLMDMSDCFQDEDYLLSNIAENYIQEGKIYCMPMRYYLPVYLVKEDISEYIDSIENLATLCQTCEKKLMEPLCYQNLSQLMLYTYGNELFTEDGVLIEDHLSSFLSSISVIAKQIGATEDGSKGWWRFEPIIGGSTHRMRISLCGDITSLYNQDVIAAITSIGDFWEMQQVNTYAKLVDGMYIPMKDNFIPNGMVGINSNTKNTDLAKDFIKYLFSMDIQSQHLNDGFPIINPALTDWYQEPYSKDSWAISAVLEPDGVTKKSLYFDPPTVEQKQRVIDEAKILTKPVSFDTPCWDMLTNGIVEYLRGEKTLEQATADISQKVNLYLSE